MLRQYLAPGYYRICKESVKLALLEIPDKLVSPPLSAVSQNSSWTHVPGRWEEPKSFPALPWQWKKVTTALGDWRDG